MSSGPPPDGVLRAFGLDETPRPLTGGRGSSWRSDGVVLKPESGPVHEWLAESVADVSADGFRLATPVRTRSGAWSCDGWSANRWLDGSEPDRTLTSSWVSIIETGRAFHRAAAHLPRPACLETREDWWAVADRAAWGERTLHLRPELADLHRRLRPVLEPLGHAQLVHGDLTGNVLVSATLSPAVIDLSPYWRPPEYAEGVVVADALCWHGASASLLEQAGVSVAAVARALLFRLATTDRMLASGAGGIDLEDEVRRYDLTATALGL